MEIVYTIEPNLDVGEFIDVLRRPTLAEHIGRELIRQAHLAAGLHTHLILVAAPKVESYYPNVGMVQIRSAWTSPRQSAGLVRDKRIPWPTGCT